MQANPVLPAPLSPDLASQLESSLATVTTALAHIVVAALVLLAGWLVAIVVARLATFLTQSLGVDRPTQRRAEARGIRLPLLPSRIVGGGIYAAIFFGSAAVSLRVIGIDLVPALAARLQDLVPRVLLAAAILGMGLPLALAAGRTLNAILPPTGPRVERLREQVATTLFVVLIVLLGLDQLGLAAQLAIAAAVTGVAACGLGLALAFGLGCRDLARDLVVEYLRTADDPSGTARR